MPYPPSFLDRFMRAVQRLPLPYWITYLLLFLVQSGLTYLAAWVDGWRPDFTLGKILFIFPLWLWAPMAIMTWLNQSAEKALSSFSLLLDCGEGELERLRHEFTTLPTWRVVQSATGWAMVYILLVYLSYKAVFAYYGYGLLTFWILTIEGMISFTLGGVIYYHSLHQLRLVERTVKIVPRFDLFHLSPVYAFSRLTARTGITWMLMAFLTILFFPISVAVGEVLTLLIIQCIFALAAFVFPLRSVNRKLVLEKRRLLGAVDQRIGLLIDRLHSHIDDDEMGEAESIGNTLMGLNTARDRISNISTWPWSAGVLTGFLSAIVLPLVLFLAQIAIEKWLVK